MKRSDFVFYGLWLTGAGITLVFTPPAKSEMVELDWTSPNYSSEITSDGKLLWEFTADYGDAKFEENYEGGYHSDVEMSGVKFSCTYTDYEDGVPNVEKCSASIDSITVDYQQYVDGAEPIMLDVIDYSSEVLFNRLGLPKSERLKLESAVMTRADGTMASRSYVDLSQRRGTEFAVSLYDDNGSVVGYAYFGWTEYPNTDENEGYFPAFTEIVLW